MNLAQELLQQPLKAIPWTVAPPGPLVGPPKMPSLEAEVRDILCDAVARPEPNERHLGTRIATRFLGLGANVHFTELRGHAARPARFKK